MDIYIKPVKKAIINCNTGVTIGDIAEIFANKSSMEDIKSISLTKKGCQSHKKLLLVSVIDIVSAIKQKHPNCTINNVGATNTVIEFVNKDKKENTIFKWIKIIFVTAVLLTGCSTALITFHIDSQLNKVLETYRDMLLNENLSIPLFMELPYSVGVAVGIIVFFNHFSGKKITEDPTPIEVEMSTYESSVIDTIIENLEVDENKK